MVHQESGRIHIVYGQLDVRISEEVFSEVKKQIDEEDHQVEDPPLAKNHHC